MSWLKIIGKIVDDDKIISAKDNRMEDPNDDRREAEWKSKLAEEHDQALRYTPGRMPTSTNESSSNTDGPKLEDYLPADRSRLDDATVEAFRSRLMRDSTEDASAELSEVESMIDDPEGSDYDKLYRSLQALLKVNTINSELDLAEDDANLKANQLAEKLSKIRLTSLEDAIRRYNSDLDEVNVAKREKKTTESGVTATEGEVNESGKLSFFSAILLPIQALVTNFAKSLLKGGIKILAKNSAKKLGKTAFKSIKKLGKRLWSKVSAPFLAISALVASYGEAFRKSKELDEEVEGLESAKTLEDAIASGGNIPAAATDINKVRENKEILARTTDRKSQEVEKYGREVPNWLPKIYADWYKNKYSQEIKAKESELNKDRKWYKFKKKYEYWEDAKYKFDEQEFKDWFMRNYESNSKLDRANVVDTWNSEKISAVPTDNNSITNEPESIKSGSADKDMTPQGLGNGDGSDSSSSKLESGSENQSGLSSNNNINGTINNIINNISNDNSVLLIENRNFKASYI